MPGYADFLGTCLRQPIRANLFPWSHNLEIFESIYHEGMEPDDWVPEYLERAI